MRRIAMTLAAGAALLVTTTGMPARADVTISGVTILSPGSTVAGTNIGNWGANWWQWAMAQHNGTDAFTDTTGAYATQNQSPPVFFVAGTGNGTPSGPVSRTFFVPRDSFLLVPLLNSEYAASEYPPPTPSDTQLQNDLAAGLATINALHAKIDGNDVGAIVNLFNYNELSGLFSYVAAADNPFLGAGTPGGPSGHAYAGGYYLMLAPIGNTTHTINFGGGTTNGFSTDATITITGIPEPGSMTLLAAGLAGIALLQRRRMLAGER